MPPQQQNTQQPQIPEVYTNTAECRITPYDFCLRFGLTEEAEVKPLLNVRMSPLHMKLFCKMIRENVEQYEKQMGEIVVPKRLGSSAQ